MKVDFYTILSRLVESRANCTEKIQPITASMETWQGDEIRAASGWHEKHEARIIEIMRDHAPHGSGFDNGCKIDFDKSTRDKLVIETAFHHMDDNGFYCGWTDHTVIVTPGFDGVYVRVTGRNMRDIKEYISDTFYNLSSIQIEG